MHPPRIAALIVTYNRKSLLVRCLLALTKASRTPDLILLVDNASTDGTRDMLREQGWLDRDDIQLLALPDNSGGAGGFAAGLKHLVANGVDWIWMMDDDAAPHPDALEELAKIAVDPTHVYGSLAVQETQTSWITTLMHPTPRAVHHANEVPERANVQFLPFLGFMIHKDLVQRIGLPDAGYFIAADDIEYCLRAQQAGADIVIAGKSRIEHPKADWYRVGAPGRSLICLRLPPWKRYYDTRNRLLIARKYYGIRLLTQTVPGSFVRLFAALRHEPRRMAQLGAFCAGMFDGLMGIKGPRHRWWRINP
ncbi:glycosyltransferase [Dyella sp. C11]|uniref:glycosyltransferase n=1 Tax=Dyella sp. C11 TaxID=2126991 RepID=UPI000D6460A3|nr:glycosyltransferase [Dyella sp. C11]